MHKNEMPITHFTLDVHNPPPLTQAQQSMLEALARMPDTEIDYTDIPAGDMTHAVAFYTETAFHTTPNLLMHQYDPIV